MFDLDSQYHRVCCTALHINDVQDTRTYTAIHQYCCTICDMSQGKRDILQSTGNGRWQRKSEASLFFVDHEQSVVCGGGMVWLGVGDPHACCVWRDQVTMTMTFGSGCTEPLPNIDQSHPIHEHGPGKSRRRSVGILFDVHITLFCFLVQGQQAGSSDDSKHVVGTEAQTERHATYTQRETHSQRD